MEFGMFHQFPALPGRPQKDAFEEAFAQIEAVVHSIEPQAHLRYFARHVRNAALDRAEPGPLFALLFADLVQHRTDCTEVLEN